MNGYESKNYEKFWVRIMRFRTPRFAKQIYPSILILRQKLRIKLKKENIFEDVFFSLSCFQNCSAISTPGLGSLFRIGTVRIRIQQLK
jgi:hypothetical protein